MPWKRPAGLPDASPAIDGPRSTIRLSQPRSASAQAVALHLVDLVDELEPLLVYAWRRHLTDAISRMLSDAEPSVDEHGMWRHIGFADLVSFTSLVRRLSERELAELVKRFEVLTSDIVTAHGGRVIKTVGDEILFSNRGAAPAAATALDLVDAMTGDDVLPEVRVGLAAAGWFLPASVISGKAAARRREMRYALVSYLTLVALNPGGYASPLVQSAYVGAGTTTFPRVQDGATYNVAAPRGLHD